MNNKMQLDYCFHCHTFRCDHASGSDEEYVLEAIKNGYKVLGFSDHVPLPHHSQKTIRMDISQLEEYVNSINVLKEKYKDQIQIIVGLECEWFDEYVDFYKTLKNYGIDYLILGQHFHIENNIIVPALNEDKESTLNKYLLAVENGVKSGLFTYIAHPDFFVMAYSKQGDEHFVNSGFKKIIELSKTYNIPLEINLKSMLYEKESSLAFPYAPFWKMVGEEGCEVVIGHDTHWPSFFNEKRLVDQALDWCEKYHLHLLNADEVIKHFN